MNWKSLIALGPMLIAGAIGSTQSVHGADAPETKSQISRPDGKPADMTKPVQVFILLGQSNMVGLGKVTGPEGSLENAVKNKQKYTYLIDNEGKWTERKDVRNVRVMVGRGGGMQLFNNEWMTVSGKNLGPEDRKSTRLNSSH